MNKMSPIAVLGAEAAARKSRNASRSIATAMAQIELDIEHNNGVYPYADGVVSTAEVLRRAGLSSAVLQKKAHLKTRGEVSAWVVRVKAKLASGATIVRRAVTERADRAQDELRALRNAWVIAEHEYVNTAAENARLERQCEDLKREVAELTKALASAKASN